MPFRAMRNGFFYLLHGRPGEVSSGLYRNRFPLRGANFVTWHL